MLAVRTDHHFFGRTAVTVGELAGERLILPERCTFLQDIVNALTALGLAARIVYRTDHDDRALALVAAGVGLAFVPGFFEIPGLTQIPISGLVISRTVGLVWPRERENADVNEFAAFAEGYGWVQ